MKRIIMAGLIVPALLIFWTAAGLGASDQKPVKMLGAMVLSGAAGAVPETAWGFMDAADYINQTGGIGGRPFVAIVEDGRVDVPTTLGIFNKYVQTEPKDELLFYCQYNSFALKALQKQINEEERIPVLAGTMSAVIFNDKVREECPYFFSTGPGWGEQWGMVLKYIKDHHSKGTPPRAAFHFIDNSSGRDPMEAVKHYAKKFGVEIVMMQPFSPTAQTFAPDFLKFRKENIEYVLFQNYSFQVGARYFNEAKKYIPELPIYGVHWTAANVYFDICKEAYDHYVVHGYPVETETSNNFVKLVIKTVEEKGRKVRAWTMYMQSWMMAALAAEAARQVSAAGKPLTRDHCREALENIKDYDMLGMYGGRTFSYATHKFSRARMLRTDWNKKTLVPLVDWVDINTYLK